MKYMTLSFNRAQVPALLKALHDFKNSKKGNDFLFDGRSLTVIINAKKTVDLNLFYDLNRHMVSIVTDVA